jgi:NAD(P)-dependent dehydrogenase (short-subunit alcohol dehydrogenase family)
VPCRSSATSATSHRSRTPSRRRSSVSEGSTYAFNNASAINLSGTEALQIKRYDLMQAINTRGTFVVSRACIPYLKRSQNPHILTLSPPISLEPRWLGPHIGYTIAKYGMTLCALGLAAEFREDGIASNALWPRTLIATAAVQNLLGGDEAMAGARKPELYADAAYAVITKPSRDCSGNAFLCEDVLAERASLTSTGTPTCRAPSRRPTCSSTTSDPCAHSPGCGMGRRKPPWTATVTCGRSKTGPRKAVIDAAPETRLKNPADSAGACRDAPQAQWPTQAYTS